MNKKLFVRLLCALLSVLTLVAIVPAMAISVAAYEIDPANGYTNLRWTKGHFFTWRKNCGFCGKKKRNKKNRLFYIG